MNATRWAPAILMVIMVVGVAAFVAAPWDGTGGDHPGRTPTVPTSSAAVTAIPSIGPGATASPAPGAGLKPVSFVGPAYDRNLVSEPTRSPGQARVWFHDGSWWAILVAESTDRRSIHELHWPSQRWVDTGVPVDARADAQHEVLWTGARLVVAGGSPRNSPASALEVSAYAYDTDSRRYVLEPDSPQRLTATGVEQVTLAQGPNGDLWLGFVQSRQVHVARAVAGESLWSAPAPIGVATDPVERAAVIPTERGIAVAWTALDANELSVGRLDAGRDDWSVSSTTIDGLEYGPDELSARSTGDGAILVAVRTSLDAVENRNLDAPQIVLARLTDAGWTQSVVSRVRDRHGALALVVDEAHDGVYVFAEGEGGVYLKQAGLAELRFAAGVGVLAVAPPETGEDPSPSPSAMAGPSVAPAVPEVVGPTTTRQSTGQLTELVVLASEDASGRYAHAVIALPGGRSVPDAAGHLGPLPDGVPVGLRPGSLAYVLRERFSPYPIGAAEVSGWEARAGTSAGLVTIAEPAAGDPSLRIASGAGAEAPRACRRFPVASSGIVVVRATVQVRGVAAGDAVVTALRSDGQEIAAVRFGGQGTLRYFVGDERITTEIAYAPGAWYQSIVTLDLDAQRYHWQLTRLGTTEPVLGVDNLALRGPAPVVDEVCVQVADPGPAGTTELYVDDVLVAIGPGA